MPFLKQCTGKDTISLHNIVTKTHTTEFMHEDGSDKPKEGHSEKEKATGLYSSKMARSIEPKKGWRTITN